MDKLTNIGAVLISEALPEDLRQEQYSLDKKGVHALFSQLAEKHPDKYKDVLEKLSAVGATAGWTEGASVSLSALRRSKAKDRIVDQLRLQVNALLDDDSLSDEERENKIVETLLPYTSKIQKEVFEESRAEDSPYVMQVESGARGKVSDLNSMRGADLLSTDQNDRFMPIPLWRGYAEGMTPAQYFASSYGQRKGALGVKFATADAGYLCFEGGTKVQMSDGSVKPIKDIAVGDMVMGSDMFGVRRPSRVSAVFRNGAQPVATYRFRSGCNRKTSLSVTCTDEHRFLLRYKKRASDYVRQDGTKDSGGVVVDKLPVREVIKTGRVAVSAKEIACGFSSTIDIPVWQAMVVGLLIGDGCTRGHSYTLASADTTLIDQVNAQLRPHNLVFTKIQRKSLSYEYMLRFINRPASVRNRLGQQVSVSQCPIHNLVRRLGLEGCLAPDKKLSDEIFKWPQESVAALLGGIIATDGSIVVSSSGARTPQFKIGMTSESVVRGMARLLADRFGIYCNDIVVSDRIGSVSFVKAVNHTAISRHLVYHLGCSIRECMERMQRFIPIPGIKGVRLQEALAVADSRLTDSANHAFYCCGREDAGVADTYDIEVDNPDHLYVLEGGLVVSNSKRLQNATHRFVVNRDTPTPTRLPTGLPVPVTDKDNIGSVLAHPVGSYAPGTVITQDILDELEDAGVDEILVHSPLTELTEDGGISRWAAGRRLQSSLPPIGENIGLQSSQAIGERLSQGALGSKHSAGVSDKVNRSGIEYLNRLLDGPENFPEAGPLAEDDGIVEKVEKATQGGHNVTIAGRQYYLPPGINPTVSQGDKVEQGDDISDGVPHPEQLVRLRGVGEARRVYLTHLREALAESGASSHRRNLEPVVSGLLNWARVTNPDGIGDNVYDDVVPFNRLVAQYKPRPTATEDTVEKAVGKYLEEPVLHYTPGTRVTRKVADKLKKWGVKSVFYHPDPPDFRPEMQRSMMSVYNDPDWRTRLLGFYTTGAFTEALHRGRESDTQSTSYAGALAKPSVLGQHLSSLGKYGNQL